jgi:hypothetical protein
MALNQVATEVCKFGREVLSENGTGSASRVLAALVVVTTLFWVTYLVIRNHALPDLAGPSLFIGAGTSATYGLNQAKSIIGAIKGNGNSQ